MDSITHTLIISNLINFLSPAKLKDVMKNVGNKEDIMNVGNKTTAVTFDFFSQWLPPLLS